MRRLAVFFISAVFIIASSNNSMLMFSVEKGRVYTEAFSLSHLINSISPGVCNAASQSENSLSSHGNYNHLHILLSSSVNHEESVLLVVPVYQDQFSSRKLIQSVIQQNASVKKYQTGSKLKFLSSEKESSLSSTVLLI